MNENSIPFNEEVLINAYCHGYFPMGEEDTDEIEWYRPDPRAIFPLGEFHVSRSLARKIKKRDYEIRINTCFQDIIRHCRKQHSEGVWITEKMMAMYSSLHAKGFAHSLEVYKNNQLAGGLYGVAIGGAFFGESMFHLQTDCSKIALCELVFRMKQKGMILLDTQFSTPHLERFGVKNVPDSEYYKLLRKAISLPVSFL